MSTARPGEPRFDALLDTRPLSRRELLDVERSGRGPGPTHPLRFGFGAVLVLAVLGAGLTWVGQAVLDGEQLVRVTGQGSGPVAVALSDRSVEVGVRFTVPTTVRADTVQVYVADRNISSIVRLWDGGGKLLTSGVLHEAAPGWREVPLRQRVRLVPGTTYLVSATVPGAVPSAAPGPAPAGGDLPVGGALSGRAGRPPSRPLELATAPVRIGLVDAAHDTAGPGDLTPAPGNTPAAPGARPTPSAPAKPARTAPGPAVKPPAGAPAHGPGAPKPGATGCVVAPHSCGLPDGTNTGIPAGIALKVVPGQVSSGPGWHFADEAVVVDGQGAVLDGLSIPYPVEVTAPDVTIKNSRISVRGDNAGISVRHSRNVTIVNNEIFGSATGPGRLLVGIEDAFADTANLQVMRNDLRHVANGIRAGSGLIQGNFIHDLAFVPGEPVNGITAGGAPGPLTIRGNTVLNQHDRTVAVGLAAGPAGPGERLVEGNLLAGGDFTLDAGGGDAVVRRNRFARSFYAGGGASGPVTGFTAGGPGHEWTDNVWDDDGTVVQP